MTYFFFHVPKTGGTSFKRVIEGWYRTARDADYDDAGLKALAEQQPPDLCIHGHFAGRLRSNRGSLLSRYPWIVSNKNAQVFTFVRDPVEQAISLYFHELAANRTLSSLLEFVSLRQEHSARNALEFADSRDIDAVISSFVMVGVTEDLQKSADRLADMMDRPRIEVPRLRVGVRNEQMQSITSEVRSKIEQVYSLECELYARARDSLEKGAPSTWKPESQFEYLDKPDRLRSEVVFEAAACAHGSLVSVSAHGPDSASRAHFSTAEPIGLTVHFDVADAAGPIEPLLTVWRGGSVAFSGAYVPAEGEPAEFDVGHHSCTAWLAANLLNKGRYEVSVSLANPISGKRHVTPGQRLVLEVIDASSPVSAQGKWRETMPGAVRPLLRWIADKRL